MEMNELLNDRAISFWFKDALKSALKRDPLDALSDAELLTSVLQKRFTNSLKEADCAP